MAGLLTDYITEHNKHEHLKSANKPDHSTETALVKIQSDKLVIILVMMSAAFDTINHDILFCGKENTLGIIGQALA